VLAMMPENDYVLNKLLKSKHVYVEQVKELDSGQEHDKQGGSRLRGCKGSSLRGSSEM